MMRSYFFYGTLLDADVVELVLGRPLAGLSPEPARLDGFRRVYAVGASYPVMIPEEGAHVDGIVVAKLLPADIGRLDRYEGSEYRTGEIEVTCAERMVTANVYLPKHTVRGTDRPWSLDRWQRLEKKAYLTAVRRWQSGG